MKTLVLYYSYTGNSKSTAEKYAQENGAEIEEVKDIKKPSTFSAYTLGSFRSMRLKSTPITTLTHALDDYDKIVVFGPVWAGSPAPAVNSIFQLIPSNKHVEIYLLSGSGNSKAEEKVKDLMDRRKITLDVFRNIKA